MSKTMPPKKTPPTPKDGKEAGQALALFAKNIEEVRRWYRGASYSGREIPHVVMSELIFGHISLALSLALEGKSWSPPENQQP